MASRIIDLSLEIDDNMPSHKLFQRPIHKPHLTHEDTRDWGMGVDGDPMTFATAMLATLDHIGTHVDAFVAHRI